MHVYLTSFLVTRVWAEIKFQQRTFGVFWERSCFLYAKSNYKIVPQCIVLCDQSVVQFEIIMHQN